MMHRYWTTAVLVLWTVSAQTRESEIRDVLRSLLEEIELEPEDQVVGGSGLDRVSKRALADVVWNPAQRMSASTISDPVPANAVIVEGLTIANHRAVVRLTYGPVPRSLELNCGREITFSLQRAPTWQVLENETWVKCAVAGPRLTSQRDADLLEAVRLAFSQIKLQPGVRIVAGSRLSAEARKVLANVAELAAADQIRTDAFALPPGYFALHSVEINGDLVTFEGTKGPVPARATLACGTNWNIRLRRRSPGWFFEDVSIRVC